MRVLQVSLGIAILSFASLSAMPGASTPMQNRPEKNGNGINAIVQDEIATTIVNQYLDLKNALVESNSEKAAQAGGKLAKTLKKFDVSSYEQGQQQELKEIVEDAIEHGEHISKSKIGHQREHFEILSEDIVDMVAITGTSQTLYQQYCPMYNENKGGFWLSTEEEIKNPYFGSKMLTCGKVQKKIG
ncbi:DUF3347 domain-containing protein [Sinomicrobium weinanense]|uniref:DUF3347 domain-containing protein n=1 Tax=Sinomicrobium weinanense TaxID=2842200 RepID=A0A926JPQ7_9FLAO|nr:DUF3347 domain-containing protein [Sinomicrobium weinanense]MBC9794976.1 DUF3347 domain-containing protein [Sinomicrobium weinanense]MBU3125163.1 DUF3347 domain-containing protein [Sinomicrobium weinanense]